MGRQKEEGLKNIYAFYQEQVHTCLQYETLTILCKKNKIYLFNLK
jgi:hypothetical protein